MLVKIIIEAFLYNYKTEKFLNNNGYILNKIKEWYYQRSEDININLPSFNLENISIKNYKIEIFFNVNIRDYKDIIDEGLDKIISDPDDDINYPIKYRNIDYAVVGKTKDIILL